MANSGTVFTVTTKGPPVSCVSRQAELMPPRKSLYGKMTDVSFGMDASFVLMVLIVPYLGRCVKSVETG
jgi:hypothetical protein